MKDPFTFSFWSGRPTTDWTFTDAYAAESNWNETFWKDERFNELLVNARAELNTKLRREMYYEMQARLRDEGGAVVPMFANHVMGLSKKVQHGKVAGNWDRDGGKAIERWWFA
jgi:peptide/nickel transport system substrate-binding protein